MSAEPLGGEGMESVLGPDGILSVPLYHGTCSIFAERIVREGLGASRPLQELGVNEFFGAVTSLAYDHLTSDPEWPLLEICVRPMVEQRAGRFNFRHGSAAYLTPSEFTARNYADSNPYGSELLSISLELFGRLRRLPSPPSIVQALPSPALMRFLESDAPQPAVIRATGVPLSYLASEDGSDPMNVVRLMDDAAATGLPPEALWQQFNFELKRPLPVRHLSYCVI